MQKEIERGDQAYVEGGSIFSFAIHIGNSMKMQSLEEVGGYIILKKVPLNLRTWYISTFTIHEVYVKVRVYTLPFFTISVIILT